MTDLRKAAEMALEALIYHQEQTRPIHKTQEVITALRQALAQPEQEPVDIHCPSCLHSFSIVPVAKRQWVSLTEDECSDIYNAHHNTYSECITSAHDLVLDVEAALRSKNT